MQPRVHDTLAENLAEAYLVSATSGEERAEELMNDYVAEDAGGPFLEEALVDEPLAEMLMLRPPRGW